MVRPWRSGRGPLTCGFPLWLSAGVRPGPRPLLAARWQRMKRRPPAEPPRHDPAMTTRQLAATLAACTFGGVIGNSFGIVIVNSVTGFAFGWD